MKKQEFLRLIDQVIEAAPGTIQGTETLADLEGWDSLSIVAFLAAYDKQFGSPPSPAALVACKTVADLLTLAGDRITD